jgi:DNA-binding transcriptional MerR regulator
MLAIHHAHRYADADLERLQRILFYRELGFGLDDIRKCAGAA